MKVKFPDTVTSDGRKVCVSYRDSQRCVYMAKFGQCCVLHVDLDGIVVYDGKKAETSIEGTCSMMGHEGCVREATKGITSGGRVGRRRCYQAKRGK